MISIDFLIFFRFQMSWRGGGAQFADFSNSGAGGGDPGVTLSGLGDTFGLL